MRGGAFGKSLLSGSPRLTVNAANAMFNFSYALLEAESRLAAATLGLDPGLAVLHVDTASRDSLALDIMKSARPQVDRYLLTWLLSRPPRREFFFEGRDGNCRLMRIPKDGVLRVQGSMTRTLTRTEEIFSTPVEGEKCS